MGNELATLASPHFRELQMKSIVDVMRLIDLQKHSYGLGIDAEETGIALDGLEDTLRYPSIDE